MELSLDQARRRAKELLRSGAVMPRDDRRARLADAQRQVANDLGFRSWPALVHFVEGSRDRLVHAALSGRADLVEGYLEQRPELARHIEVALVIGAIEPVQAALRDPEFVNRELTHGHKPFELPVYSPAGAPHAATACGACWRCCSTTAPRSPAPSCSPSRSCPTI